MGRIITIREYYNLIGASMFPDWSEETVDYYSERKNELSHLKERALAVLKVAFNQIWKDGKVKTSYRLEQGYFDPNFKIEEFYFAQNRCIDKNGNDYWCAIELHEENRGARIVFTRVLLEPLIKNAAHELFLSKGIDSSKMVADAIIAHVRAWFKEQNKPRIPSNNTVRDHFLDIYPECRKSSRNSKN